MQPAPADGLDAADRDAPRDGFYGVRGKADGLLAGSGGFDALNPSPRSTSPTPDQPCTVGANGWCDTPAHIAATAFGWDGHANGAGVVIGIVDTGIDLNHPDFAGRILTGTCIVSSVNPCTAPDDQVGGDDAVFPGPNATHGTHVAGIAAGALTGIATAADILPVKVCSSTSSACANVDPGIVYASQHGASVINISIGGPILTSADIASFRSAISNGALLVVAAGNSGTKDPSSGFLAGAALQDGVRGSMIVVGATGAGGVGGFGQATSFTQVPSTQCEVHGGQRFCLKDYFVVAPGGNIWSTVGNGPATGANYGFLSGTSMATPYVTGVAAVIKGNWPTLTSSQIASIIFQTADDIGAPGVDPVYGRGAVDITKALGPAGAAIVANHSFSIGPNPPAGQLSVIAAVAGGQASASTLSQFGVPGATSSLASGPLSVALRRSAILKRAVVVDSFGRAFKADLTKAAFVQPFVDLDRFLQSSFYQNSHGFGAVVDTPLGLVAASGYTVSTSTMREMLGVNAMSDHARAGLQDFGMSLAVAPGVALEMGYNARMAGRFNVYDANASVAYDGLFFSASGVNSPYVALTDGGAFVGSSVKLDDEVRLQFGASWLAPETPQFEVPLYPMIDQLMGKPRQFDQRRAQASLAAVTWDFASWGGLGMTVSQTTEQNGLLGGFTSGALAFDRQAKTTAVGLSGRVGFGDGWVTTLSYSEGLTHVSLASNSIVDGSDLLHSRSYGVAFAKRGVFGDADSLGLAVTRPIQVYQGGLDFSVATGADQDGNLTMSHERVALSSATPETDVEAGYVSSYLGGALSLQANAAYQINVDGRSGTNAVAVLSRVTLNF